MRALSWFGSPGFEIVARLGVSVWPSPRVAWRDAKAADRSTEQAARRFESALTRGPASLSLGKVLQLYLMKATPQTDPAFFQADHAYYEQLDRSGVTASAWKKAIGELVYRIAVGWLNRRLVHTQRLKEAT